LRIDNPVPPIYDDCAVGEWRVGYIWQAKAAKSIDAGMDNRCRLQCLFGAELSADIMVITDGAGDFPQRHIRSLSRDERPVALFAGLVRGESGA
jgi:hypothetical protein